MLLRLLLLLVMSGKGIAFVLRPSYDVYLKDDAVYNIGEIVEEDYEMMSAEDTAQFRIDDNEKLAGLNKVASKSYDKHIREEKTRHVVREWFRGTEPTRPVVTDTEDQWLTGYAQVEPLTPSVTEQSDHRKRRSDSPDFYEYDYSHFMKEYYDETIEQRHSNETYYVTLVKPEPNLIKDTKKIITLDLKSHNCTEEELRHIGLKALNCIAHDYWEGRLEGAVLAQRLWRICRIWLIVYVVVAVPLWCTRGWCCCCLFCKFFKPRQTINTAKAYLVRNPPGTLANSKGTHTNYQPTEYEVESYEELEHFIRTM